MLSHETHKNTPSFSQFFLHVAFSIRKEPSKNNADKGSIKHRYVQQRPLTKKIGSPPRLKKPPTTNLPRWAQKNPQGT